jgi:hypothetical protein
MLTVKHPDHAETIAVCDSQRDLTRTQYDPELKLCCALVPPHPV